MNYMEELERQQDQEYTSQSLFKFPDVDKVCAIVHTKWLLSNLSEGIRSEQNFDGEQLMVPWNQLPESEKEEMRKHLCLIYEAINELR